MDALTPPLDPALWRPALEQAQRYANAARAPSTRRAYISDWRQFSCWCTAHQTSPLPADPRLVALYLSEEAARGLAPATLGRRLAAIGLAHRRAACMPPHLAEGGALLLEVLTGIRRSWRQAPQRKAAADADVLRDLLRALPEQGLKNLRNRAVLAFGMAGAFRRSELAALRIEQLTREPRGMRVRFGVTKTDQEGKGTVIAIPDGRRIRPIALLETWLQAAKISKGFVFRRVVAGHATDAPMSDRAVARIVQRAAEAAGYDPARFGGHSLRAGFITASARAGASIFQMKDVSRHKSTDVLAAYVREEGLFEQHAGEAFL
ncbi:site-specific integrase (plasmid) [Kozakia baliensis]|uniref:site-specific integrase n=1 Tax=Kozakia baliensis TaxID=153496 RepID=UPI00345C4D9A